MPYLPPLCPAAELVRARSLEVWRERAPIEIVGRSMCLDRALAKVHKVARFAEPVLILGESGVGKEAFAQALYLLSERRQRPLVSVNSPQYQEGNLTVSELFGHKKGSFTGAVADRKGHFETAEGGMIFLDEIGDLPMAVQTMLLRALSSGEFQPLGGDRPRRMNVRVVAATNQNLNQLVAKERFRHDLLFRLRAFSVEIPPLRERGDDWKHLVRHTLRQLAERYGVAKVLSRESWNFLSRYSWPGNVRELISLVTTGYALSDRAIIEPATFADLIDQAAANSPMEITRPIEIVVSTPRPAALAPVVQPPEDLPRVGEAPGDFWTKVQEPFLDRELNRAQVRAVIARGLESSLGSYRRLLASWKLPPGDYQRFMDFLRHHRLKP